MNSANVYRELSLYGVLSRYAGSLLYFTMGKAGLKLKKPSYKVDLDCAGELLLIGTAEKQNPQTTDSAITEKLRNEIKDLSWACFLNFKVTVESTDDDKIVKITLSI